MVSESVGRDLAGIRKDPPHGRHGWCTETGINMVGTYPEGA
jgi:hypothetical protein